MSNQGCSIIIRGTGSYAPKQIVTNNDLSARVDTSDEWIQTRTGIKERRMAAPDEAASHLALKASRKALEAAKIEPGEIDLIIVATLTPDMIFPSTSCLLQSHLGLEGVASFDLGAACSGFIYALETGRCLLAGNPRFRNALIVGTEKLSTVTDWDDRGTCILFGDAAGAVVLGKTEEADTGVLGSLLGADGSKSSLIYMPAGGSARPASIETIEGKEHYLRMNGREVFKLAVRVMERSAMEILDRHGFTRDDIDCVIPHQANMRIIESVSSHLGIPIERFFNNLPFYGNTSAASVPLALDEAVRTARVKPGDLVLLVGFGAGLTWGASLIRWH